MFVEEELFEGNNLYRCAQCDRLVTAAKVSGGERIWLHTLMMLILSLQFKFFTFLLCCSYLVCQTQETPSVLDGVVAQIQLRLCQI